MNQAFDASTQYRINSRAVGARRNSRSAFTLIELLVVIALTAVLATLLFVPLVKGFQYTSFAQTIAAGQDGERLLMRELQRDLASAAGVRDTQGKYLNIVVLQKSSPNDTTGSQALVHLYNGYVDIVPPRTQCQENTGACTAAGSNYVVVTDPTTRLNVLVKKGASYVSKPGVETPIAPASSFTRYFIGLKYPCNLSYSGSGTAVAQPYQNIYDRQWEERSGDGSYSSSDVVNQQLNNTYVLYVATVSPYNSDNSINTNLFPTDSSGNIVLDDPDFFRIVTTGDYNSITRANYTSDEVSAHNKRVYNWWKISHREITGCEYDLLQYARAGSDVVWGNASSLPEVNPLTGSAYKYVGEYSNGAGTSAHFLVDNLNKQGADTVFEARSSFLINPNSVGGENAKLTAVDYASEGAQESSFLEPGAQFIPTMYNMSMSQIQGSPNFMIDTGDATNIFATRTALSSEIGTSLASGGSVAAGDLMETLAARSSDFTTGMAGSPVYDITAGSALSSASSYVPFTYNANAGTINFAASALPPSSYSADPSNSLNPWWSITLSSASGSATYDSTTDDMVIDLDNSTLFGSTSPFVSGGSPAYAMVVGSERIKGPDRSAGPAQNVTSTGASAAIQYPLVPYTRVPYGSTIGVNEYAIEYLHAYSSSSYGPRIHLGPVENWQTLSSSDPGAHTILLAFNVQNNIKWSGSLPTSAAVTATYSSGDAMRVMVGLRVYDTSSSQAQSISLTGVAPVGNGTR